MGEGSVIFYFLFLPVRTIGRKRCRRQGLGLPLKPYTLSLRECSRKQAS